MAIMTDQLGGLALSLHRSGKAWVTSALATEQGTRRNEADDPTTRRKECEPDTDDEQDDQVHPEDSVSQVGSSMSAGSSRSSVSQMSETAMIHKTLCEQEHRARLESESRLHGHSAEATSGVVIGAGPPGATGGVEPRGSHTRTVSNVCMMMMMME